RDRPFDEVAAYLARVARPLAEGDLGAWLHRQHVVGVVHFHREAGFAHVLDPLHAAAAARALVHGQQGQGGGGGRRVGRGAVLPGPDQPPCQQSGGGDERGNGGPGRGGFHGVSPATWQAPPIVPAWR